MFSINTPTYSPWLDHSRPPLAVTSPDASRDDGHRPLPSTAEKIAATYGAGLASQVQFLPYLETVTQDTPEIRDALRSMLKDPYVKAAWFTQCFSVAAEEFQIHGYQPEASWSQVQVDFIRDAVNRLPLGFAGLSLAILLPLGPDGVSVVEPVTEVESRGRWAGHWVPSAVKAKDIKYLYLLGDRFRNITKIRSMRTGLQTEFPAHDFLITRYAPIFDEVFGMAAFRASYLAFWMVDSVRKLRAIHHEKRTGGTLIGKYATPDQRATLEDTLRRLKSSTWACVPEGVMIEVLDLSNANDTDYAKFEEDKIRDIVVGISFAELQMLTSPNERGDTRVHQQQSNLPVWYLMRIVEETINRQWIPRYIDWNFGAVDGYPRLTIGGPDQANNRQTIDLVEKAQALGFDDLDKEYYAKALNLQRTREDGKQLRPRGQAASLTLSPSVENPDDRTGTDSTRGGVSP